jgi:hypothetical protein
MQYPRQQHAFRVPPLNAQGSALPAAPPLVGNTDAEHGIVEMLRTLPGR